MLRIAKILSFDFFLDKSCVFSVPSGLDSFATVVLDDGTTLQTSLIVSFGVNIMNFLKWYCNFNGSKFRESWFEILISKFNRNIYFGNSRSQNPKRSSVTLEGEDPE